MPRNNGIYTAPPSNWNPAVDGLPADPSSWNDLLTDMSAALSQSVSKDGQTTITGDLNMGGNRLMNLGTPSAAGDAVRYGMLSKGTDIASAASITIPTDGILFDVTGTVDISAITGGFSGKFVLLRFTGVLNLIHSANLVLPAGADYRTTAGEIVMFVRTTGSAWQMFAAGGGGWLVGDYLDTLRNPGTNWLRRDGALYDRDDYPALAALIPPVSELILSNRMTSTGVNAAWICEGEDDSLVGVCQDGSDCTIIRSDDGGETWQTISTVTGCNGRGGIAYGGGIYIVAGSGSGSQNVAVSPDGLSWGTPTALPSTPYPNVDGIFYLNDAFFILNNESSANHRRIYRSTNGASWSAVLTQTGAGNFVGMAYGNSVYVAVGAAASGNQNAASSSDGLSWTGRNASNLMGDVRFFSGAFIASPIANQNIQRSTDGVTWSIISTLSDLTYQSKLVVSGDRIYLSGTGKLYDSANAVSWNQTLTGRSVNHGRGASGVDGKTAWVGSGVTGYLLLAERVSLDQFKVPDDNPTNGWIKAL